MTALKSHRIIDGRKYYPSNVYPWGSPWSPNTTKSLAKEKAEAWANHLRNKGFRARVVTNANSFTVFEGGRK